MTALLIGSNWAESSFWGAAAALTAAFLWAVATLMFGKLGQQLSPLVLNIVKGILAVAFTLITLAIPLFGSETLSLEAIYSALFAKPSLTFKATVYLFLSGALGIGLGDTAYFATINALGARRALLLETLAPPMTAVLAWVFLSERLSVMAVIGIGLTLIGIAWVISERVPGANHTKWHTGIGVALIAVFSQAAGAVLSRAAFVDSALDPLWSSLFRLLAGLLFMGVLAVLRPQQLGAYQPVKQTMSIYSENYRENYIEHSSERSETGSPVCSEPVRSEPVRSENWQFRWQQSLLALRRPSLIGAVALAAFLGTYLGIWLQQIALKYTAAGIAQSLLATSPIFVLPMAAVLGDRINVRAILGAVVALSGVWILLAS